MQNSEVPGNAPSKDSIASPDYQISRQGDEIDLIDLFLFFWMRRKLFLSAAVLIAVVGIIGFEVLNKSKSVSIVQSVVEVRRSVKGAPVVTPQALAKRVDYVDLPQFSSAPEYASIRSHILSTTSEPIANTDMIEITSVVPNSVSADVVKFHERLVERISADVTFPSIPIAEDISDRLAALKESIAQLQEMIKKQGQQMSPGEKSQSPSNKAFLQQLTRQGNDLKREQNALSVKFSSLVSVLSNNQLRILARGRVSTKAVGMTTSKAYAMIIMLAVFGAIFIIAGTAFVAKVRERMAGRE